MGVSLKNESGLRKGPNKQLDLNKYGLTREGAWERVIPAGAMFAVLGPSTT